MVPGRPDMSPMLFAKAIHEGETQKSSPWGRSTHFSYIDDVVEVLETLDKLARPNLEMVSMYPDPASSSAPWKIYNIGNSCVLLNYLLH